MKHAKLFTTIAAALALAALALASIGCSSAEPAKVMALNGPTGIGMAQLSQDSAKYETRFVGNTDEVVSALSNGSIDIAAVPTNLASMLYNKTEGKVKMIAVDTFGSLYIVQNGSSVKSLAGLKGKTIYATGQGANPQYILEYLLSNAGLKVGSDVTVKYVAEHSELAALVAQGKADIAMLPEPFVSVAKAKNPKVTTALDLGECWSEASGSKLAMGCVVARADYLDAHKSEVEQFLKDLAASVETASGKTAETAQLCADKGILPNAQIAESAIPNCSLTCITGAGMQQPVTTFLTVLQKSNPKSIGGKLPGDDFYYGL